jgi:hypothetical protein
VSIKKHEQQIPLPKFAGRNSLREFTEALQKFRELCPGGPDEFKLALAKDNFLASDWENCEEGLLMTADMLNQATREFKGSRRLVH